MSDIAMLVAEEYERRVKDARKAGGAKGEYEIDFASYASSLALRVKTKIGHQKMELFKAGQAKSLLQPREPGLSFEEIISEIDKAIYIESGFSNFEIAEPKITAKGAEDKYSNLIDIEVMEDELFTCCKSLDTNPSSKYDNSEPAKSVVEFNVG
ncbi:hypothetical protein CMV_030360 [Castanea mollissima]|uniref:Uncharacterized protein n=1 Tax=Castanea mollissima TaxID=60419 RepID=A0A8J4V6G9_9ROSI|nr:hypothetical protein CMV_030360 [Castanea mollissima]